MAKQSILDQYEIGATVALSGNVAELTLTKDHTGYRTRNQRVDPSNKAAGEYQEQRLRIQLNSGQYVTAWFIVPPFFETPRQPVNFNGEVNELNGNRFLVACKTGGSAAASPALPQPGPGTPPAPNRQNLEEKPDWDKIAEGKVRTLLTSAAIESGQLGITGVRDLDYWLKYCMTGTAPLPPSKIPEPDKSIVEERAREETDTPYY